MKALIVVTTLPNLKAALDLSRQIIERKLAACVSVHDRVVSTYRWKGKLERSKEATLWIKTDAQAYRRLESFLKAKHPYDLPEIIAWPITQGSREYLQWIKQSLR